MSALLTAKDLEIAGRLQLTSVAFDAGTLTCLIGPNGSGKTSLLHTLAGIGDHEGEVVVEGVNLRAVARQDRPWVVTYLPASREVKWPLTAADLIRLGGEEDIHEIIANLELATFADRRVDQLSTGERTRVLIARALAPRPKVVLLDEPVANLDPLWQLKLMQHLHDLAHEQGAAVVIAAHDLDLAGRFADRLIVMDNGRSVADGPPELLDSDIIRQVFGVERRAGAWQPMD